MNKEKRLQTVLLVIIWLMLLSILLFGCSPDIGIPTKPNNAKKVNKYNNERLNTQFGW